MVTLSSSNRFNLCLNQVYLLNKNSQMNLV